MKILQIESATEVYAEKYNLLMTRVDALAEEQNQLWLDCKSELITMSLELAGDQEILTEMISESPELFKKPRTISVNGFKVGFQKMPGKVVVPDQPATIKKIKKKGPAAEQLLIKKTEKVIAAGVKTLTVKECQSLGITVTEDTDQVIINPTDKEAQKRLNEILDKVNKDN